jgi:hypothetical protein
MLSTKIGSSPIFFSHFSVLVKSMVSHLIKRGWGTSTELKMAEETVYQCVVRQCNRFRKEFLVSQTNSGELLLTRKHKDLSRPWLVSTTPGPKRPGDLLKFLDDVRNERDEFIQDLVLNKNVTEDPIFLNSLNRIKVSSI